VAWQSRRLLDAARDGIIELFTSPPLLEELEDVLSRKKLVTLLEAANVTVSELVLGYAALATLIEADAIEPVILADPDDDAVLACALAAQSEVITSGDNHLLDLKEHQAIRILSAAELLAELSL
jgi:putative PIN family toxin of toxin-antitoxin system